MKYINSCIVHLANNNIVPTGASIFDIHFIYILTGYRMKPTLKNEKTKNKGKIQQNNRKIKQKQQRKKNKDT